MVPLMEMPTGELVPESAIIAQFGVEKNAGKGIELVPSDPLVAAQMRLRMEDVSKLIRTYWQLGNEDGIKKFNEETIPAFEKMCKETNGKWLMGTDDLTMLDIHAGSFFEMFYIVDTYETTEDFVQMSHRAKYPRKKVNVMESAPALKEYVERFRDHPAIKPYQMKPGVFAA